MTEFCSNNVSKSFLYIYGLAHMNSVVIIENSRMFFEKITSEKGSITVLYQINVTIFIGAVIFQNNTSLACNDWNSWNSCDPSATMLLRQSTAYIYHSNVSFFNNSASLSGGITLSSTGIISVNTCMIFKYNQGGDGGAMAFYEKSYVLPQAMFKTLALGLECYVNSDDQSCPRIKTELYFYHNLALRRGGAIFIEDSDYINSMTRLDYVFFIHTEMNIDALSQILTLYFSQNTAKLVGNEIYGGWIDYVLHRPNILVLMEQVPKDDPYAVSSNPIRICMCVEIPVCNVTEHQMETFLGQTIEIEAVAVGQRMGIVPSLVVSDFSDDEGSLGEGQNVQLVNKVCTTLKFTVFSSMKVRILKSTAQNNGVPKDQSFSRGLLSSKYNILFQQLSINITLKELMSFGILVQ